ncbi:MAG: hypothetical protein HOQ46_05115 [Saccharothrix sp.]|nr:hypothetical protein [Saccharothrix sp.]
MLRVKVEAAPGNEGVPASDLDASDELYFEHHVKVRLRAGEADAVDRLRWATSTGRTSAPSGPVWRAMPGRRCRLADALARS